MKTNETTNTKLVIEGEYDKLLMRIDYVKSKEEVKEICGSFTLSIIEESLLQNQLNK